MLNEVFNRRHKSTALPDLGDAKGDLVRIFNNHFASIGINLSKKISQPQGVTIKDFLSGSYTDSFFMIPTDSSELLKIILDLRSSYSAGVDGICSKIMKAFPNVIVEPLAHCINISLLTGIVPKMTKMLR